MPRVNRVKKARALYHTKPVLDESGEPKRTPVTKRVFNYTTKEYEVVPKTDKHGRQVYHTVTVRDLDRPKPNLRCDFPGCDIDGGEILPGTAYKFLALRFGQKNRHEAHPDWQYWEYSSSVAAQAARLQSEMHQTIDDFEFSAAEDFDSLRDDLASQAQDFADERQEAVDNMPEALQDGSQAQEYAEAAESWVSEIEGAQEPSEEFGIECDACDGTGTVEGEPSFWAVQPDGREDGPFDSEQEALDALEDPENDDEEEGEVREDAGDDETCEACDGTGHRDDEPSEDWVEAARDALREAVDALEI